MITDWLIRFTGWLGGTGLNAAVAGHAWVVPAVQTLHILSVAVVLVGVLLVNLRIVGVVERTQPVAAVLDRFLVPIAAAVAVLAVTGSLLIAGEPTRALFRTVFWVKMALIVTAAALTWSHRRSFPAGTEGAIGGSPARRTIAAVALLLWLAVVVAGRWIAYVDAWPGAPE